MSRLAIGLIVASCLVGIALAQDVCNGNDIGNSGQFDFYVFEQSWPAEFCYSHKSYPGCENPTSYQQVNFTIHGLWPNYNQQQDGSWWPQCCQDSPDNLTLSNSVVQALLPELQLYWPNEEDVNGSDSTSLWGHEWQKHGTCSGLMQQPYMEAVMQVGNSPNVATPALIQNNIGGSINLSDLQSYYGTSNCSGDCLVGITCKGAYLESITTCWTKDLKQMTCPAAVLTSSNNCQSSISIDGFSSSKAAY